MPRRLVKPMRIRSRVVTLAFMVVLLLQMSPAMAGGQRDNDHNNRPVTVAFTKWITGFAQPNTFDSPAATRALMAGFVGGDVGGGDFVGEVIDHRLSTPGTVSVPINALQAIYEVRAGQFSFIALIRGATNGATGRGLLDGVILDGWRTGAPVHVEFQTIPATTGCAGAPLNTTCFEGTIHVGRVPARRN